MADHVTPERRSFIMSKVKQKNTGPEMVLRIALHALGYRYRLHRRDLPGSPDLVFPSRRRVIFVHGCFWHGHGCRWGKAPKSRTDYWLPKIKANKERDNRALTQLAENGWEAMVVWQCELRDPEPTIERVVAFLNG
ncbi:very short patch repair endonuclease [Thioclava nitratireducens]|uniref:Very short patch repair endonuclease n=1 Tax=Thioclava nitratireducens TaxID=1915078 RepID=A0ABN4XGQ9_9RHOB|nr:very short patch repair endonuclease [Thioclava nitratireducens]AQS48736.1 very short patch repair endonuclease [Thioclava nitratireducens]